jgi:hypothetical protein
MTKAGAAILSHLVNSGGEWNGELIFIGELAKP